ncbi:uncharacterized protein [Lolium perenne]|uniref:uncharacterized protein n=1 Tax=Lolium perenne TaxID=4522 RepID=UPI0021F619F2|nr:uncharacterized protein LOC127332170 [Lolium perenne]
MSEMFDLPNGTIIDVSGGVTYVGPAEADFCAPSGMREIAIVDSGHNTIFLRFFGESTYLLGDQLLSAEQNNAVVVASNMEVVHQSKSLDNTSATTVTFEPCAKCSQFNILEGVRQHVRAETSIREHVKKLVLYRRDIYEGQIDVTEEPPSKTSKLNNGGSNRSSVKDLFGYMTQGVKRSTMMDELD